LEVKRKKGEIANKIGLELWLKKRGKREEIRMEHRKIGQREMKEKLKANNRKTRIPIKFSLDLKNKTPLTPGHRCPEAKSDFFHLSPFYIIFSKRKIVCRSILTILAIILLASSLPAQNVEWRDDLGHKLTLAHCPQKIISLAPNLTEILFALGLSQEIIGVTRYCDFPEEAKTKEKIGGLVDINLEKIQSLHPDLILGFRGNPRGIIEKLYKNKMPIYVFDSGQNFSDLFSLIARIGQLTCKEKQAGELIASLETSLDEIKKKLAPIKNDKKVFLTLYGQGSGLWTCGRRSYLTQLLQAARLENLASSTEGNWLIYSQERFIADNPELILILCRDRVAFEKACSWFESQSVFKKVKAVRERNFFFLEENQFSRFSPRLVEAFKLLVTSLYPELFPEPK